MVVDVGIGCDDVFVFWFGESDEVMLELVCEVVVELLWCGEIFYVYNLGLFELCEVLVGYMSVLYCLVGVEWIVVILLGVSVLMIVM